MTEAIRSAIYRFFEAGIDFLELKKVPSLLALFVSIGVTTYAFIHPSFPEWKVGAALAWNAAQVAFYKWRRGTQ